LTHFIWLKKEKLACEAQAKLEVIPNDVVEKLSEAIEFDIERINEIDRQKSLNFS